MAIVVASQESALSYPLLNILFTLLLTTRLDPSLVTVGRKRFSHACIVGGFHPNQLSTERSMDHLQMFHSRSIHGTKSNHPTTLVVPDGLVRVCRKCKCIVHVVIYNIGLKVFFFYKIYFLSLQNIIKR